MAAGSDVDSQLTHTLRKARAAKAAAIPEDSDLPQAALEEEDLHPDVEDARRLESANSQLQAAVETTRHNVGRLVAFAASEEGDVTKVELRSREAFETLLRTLSKLFNAYGEASHAATRKRLKKQAEGHESKLHTMRKASTVEIGNTKAVMEAVHAKKLEEQVEKLCSGDNFLLREYKEKVEALEEQMETVGEEHAELENKLNAMRAERDKNAEKEANARALLDDANATMEAATTAYNEVAAESENLKEQIQTLVTEKEAAETALSDAQAWAEATMQELRQRNELLLADRDAATHRHEGGEHPS